MEGFRSGIAVGCGVNDALYKHDGASVHKALLYHR